MKKKKKKKKKTFFLSLLLLFNPASNVLFEGFRVKSRERKRERERERERERIRRFLEGSGCRHPKQRLFGCWKPQTMSFRRQPFYLKKKQMPQSNVVLGSSLLKKEIKDLAQTMSFWTSVFGRSPWFPLLP